MAKILRDYKCPEHGFFESFQPVCPEGCTEGVKIVYLKAPSLLSSRTKNNDKNIKQLASDFNMSNVKSTKEGENQSGYYTRHNQKPPEPRAGDAAIWGGGFKGLDMGALLSGRAIRPVADEPVGINPKSVGNLTGPKASVIMNDHENLQIKK